jgi:hypothetical protein
MSSHKLLIKQYLEKIESCCKITNYTIHSINNQENDLVILKSLYFDLSSFKFVQEIQKDSKIYQNLQYLYIFFFDYLFLKTFFKNYFKLSEDFEIANVKEIEYADKSIHPDIMTSLKLHKLNQKHINKYIGLSHLCCFACSVVMDALEVDFRGINRKFEIKWNHLLELNSEGNFNINSIVKKLQMFETNLKNITDFSKIYEHNIDFESKITDRCNHSSNLISDDICFILNYFKAHGTGEYLFNIKLKNLIYLGKNFIAHDCYYNQEQL